MLHITTKIFEEKQFLPNDNEILTQKINEEYEEFGDQL